MPAEAARAQIRTAPRARYQLGIAEVDRAAVPRHGGSGGVSIAAATEFGPAGRGRSSLSSSPEGGRRGCSTGPPGRGAGQGRRGSPHPRRPCARPPRRRPRGRHRLARQGARAQSEPRGGLVPRRVPESLARRPRRRHRALRACHALEPPRSGAVSNAGRNGGRTYVRRALRHRVVMGGEGIPGFAELPDGRRHHRHEPCACRPDEARRAMDHLRQLDPALRISNLEDWLPIHRPEDFATFAEGLRRAGLPE